MGRDLADMGFSTIAVHGGVSLDPSTGAIGPHIATSTNFAAAYGSIGFSAEATVADEVPFAYAREGHPNAAQLEQKLALLDGAEAAVVFATGIAAISGLMTQVLSPGDHLLVSDVSYAGTAEFTRGLLAGMGIEVSVADMSDLDDVRAALRPNTRLIHAETPCNPVLKLVDIRALARVAHDHGAELCVDGTFATPAVTRPLLLGADYVVHSLTKYMGGHGDALGGAVLGRAEPMDRLRREVGVHLGGTLSAFNCWLILRGLETLPIRMAAYARGATQVARFLEDHPKVRSVRYPGLPSHPQYALAQRQMSGPSGMIAFTVADHERFGDGLKDQLRIFHFAASLGLSRSLILEARTEDLRRTTFKLDEAHLRRYREWAGDGFYRLSIGLEDPDDLCADLERALSAS
ncbi:aminotransferase class I/II-fold pyridoxal phosphate-dependent enzyme [Nonomuraea antimicrobica]|uniref:Aminotransferase class I/II-fold pyridoxal phosphate-dependent enzyme n=1 Tax=Nonomuraea antimicrobica TaxID=561173 RepID=A0ABP7BJ85_9ACTN